MCLYCCGLIYFLAKVVNINKSSWSRCCVVLVRSRNGFNHIKDGYSLTTYL